MLLFMFCVLITEFTSKSETPLCPTPTPLFPSLASDKYHEFIIHPSRPFKITCVYPRTGQYTGCSHLFPLHSIRGVSQHRFWDQIGGLQLCDPGRDTYLPYASVSPPLNWE